MYCRRLTIEQPGSERFVSVGVLPFPTTPPNGARIRVAYMGICYPKSEVVEMLQTTRMSTASSETKESSLARASFDSACKMLGYTETAYFTGFEIVGVIMEFGENVKEDCGFSLLQSVIVYPYKETTNICTDLFCVDDLKYLIPVPEKIPLRVACTLTCGGLCAMSAVSKISYTIGMIIKTQGLTGKFNILVLGSGGLALWTIQLMCHHFAENEDINIFVASSMEDGLELAKAENPSITTFPWPKDQDASKIKELVYENCGGLLDIIVNLGATPKSIKRSIEVVNSGGYIFINEQASDILLTSFVPDAYKQKKYIETVYMGNIEQLKELVGMVENETIRPPPCEIYPFDEAAQVYKKLSCAEIMGRAVLQFDTLKD